MSYFVHKFYIFISHFSMIATERGGKEAVGHKGATMENIIKLKNGNLQVSIR